MGTQLPKLSINLAQHRKNTGNNGELATLITPRFRSSTKKFNSPALAAANANTGIFLNGKLPKTRKGVRLRATLTKVNSLRADTGLSED